jgi:hypothetical protein
MKVNEIGNEEEEPGTQTELEKLLEQKQQETEALKRLILVLGKADPTRNDHPGENE